MFAPIVHVEEATAEKAGQVFSIRAALASGYQTATDTFLSNQAGKIVRQHVVVHYLPVQASWDNHFALFGGQVVERVLRDYSEDSVVTVYKQLTDSTTTSWPSAGKMLT